VKVVQVQTQAEAAGAQRVSDMVGEGLRARGHDVRTVFMYRKTDVYDGDPYADFVLADRPRGTIDQVRAVAGLVAYLRRARPEVVISYQHYGNIFGTLGARLAGARHVIANQSGPPWKTGVPGLLSRIDRLMGTYGLYQQNVVNSGWNEAQFADFPKAYRQRLRRIDHGVAAPDRAYGKDASRAAFGLPREPFLVVSSGRLTTVKNHAAIVAAMGRLPQVHVALAGAGPEREALVALAAATGVASRLHFVGEVPPRRIFEFLAAGDAYAFPSLSETFGLAVVEAAIAGLPVVASDLDVLREVLTNGAGEPAALFVTGDADGMAAGLTRITAEPELASRLAAAGRRLAEKYSPEVMCAGYERLFA
jgi:glycosyltransferase involved in cell wall biosynthesis